MAIMLHIGKRHTVEDLESIADASRIYREYRDATGEGASTFPDGKIVMPDGTRYAVSYNGKVWSGRNAKKNVLGELVFDPRATAVSAA